MLMRAIKDIGLCAAAFLFGMLACSAGIVAVEAAKADEPPQQECKCKCPVERAAYLCLEACGPRESHYGRSDRYYDCVSFCLTYDWKDDTKDKGDD